eukprot:3396259-Ditylum_brightwellii.AAC.1
MSGSQSDIRLLHHIWRVNLDVCWAWTRSTVGANVAGLRKAICFSEDLLVPSPYLPRGPWPLEDKVGFSVALQIICASLEPGHYSTTSQIFDTVRKLRSSFANTYMSSAEAQIQGVHFCGEKGSSYCAVPHPTHSTFFELFMCGLQCCMGRDVCPNMALDYR